MKVHLIIIAGAVIFLNCMQYRIKAESITDYENQTEKETDAVAKMILPYNLCEMSTVRIQLEIPDQKILDQIKFNPDKDMKYCSALELPLNSKKNI